MPLVYTETGIRMPLEYNEYVTRVKNKKISIYKDVAELMTASEMMRREAEAVLNCRKANLSGYIINEQNQCSAWANKNLYTNGQTVTTFCNSIRPSRFCEPHMRWNSQGET